MHSGETTSLELAEDLLLHAHLLEHRLEHEVAVLEALVRGRAGDDRAQEARLVLGQPPARGGVVELLADVRDSGVDDVLVEVADDERELEPADEQRGELARHQPRAEDAHLPDRARLGVGHAHLPLRAPLHEIERVERRLRLAAEDQVGDRLFLLAVALFDRPAGRPLDQVERAVRRDRRAVDGVVELRAGPADRLLHLGRVGRLALERRADELERERDRFVEELDRLEDAVGEPVLEGLGAAQHPVLPQWVLDDEADGGLRIDEPRDELRSAPAGDDPEEALGQGEMADASLRSCARRSGARSRRRRRGTLR